MQNDDSICIDLNFAIGWNRFNLSLVGVWPDPLQSPKQKGGLSRCRFMIASFFMLGFMCIPQSVNLIFIWGNADMMTENLATANIPVANAFMKAFTIWRRRKGTKQFEAAKNYFLTIELSFINLIFLSSTFMKTTLYQLYLIFIFMKQQYNVSKMINYFLFCLYF